MKKFFAALLAVASLHTVVFAETPVPKSFADFEKLTFEQMKTLPDYKWSLTTPVKESDLQNKSETEVILFRNSIYAQHGFRFSQKPLANYFLTRSWYKPTVESLNVEKLSAVSKKNVETFMKFQASTKTGNRDTASQYGWLKDKVAYHLFLMGFCTYTVNGNPKAGMVVFEPAGQAKVFHSKFSRASFEPYAYEDYLDKSTAQWGKMLLDATWSINVNAKETEASITLDFADEVYNQFIGEDGKSLLAKGQRRVLTIPLDIDGKGYAAMLKNRTCNMEIVK